VIAPRFSTGISILRKKKCVTGLRQAEGRADAIDHRANESVSEGDELHSWEEKNQFHRL
jgi:hypothetical protein